MQITDELRVLVEAEVEKAIADMRRLDNSMESTEKEAKALSTAIDKIAGTAMILSTAVAGAGIAAIKFAGNIEQSKTALAVLLKDGEKANVIFGQWQELGAQTPFSVDDFTRAGTSLLAFNVEADKVTDTLRRIGDVSAGTGSSIADIAELYGKAKVQGRLFAEDINQFQGRGIPVIQALAKTLGTSESNIRDMVQAGKVGFPELEQAFASMTGPGGQFEGMMERLSKETLGKFSTVMDDAKMSLASFGEVMIPTANDFLDSADSMFQGLSNLDDGTKRFIVSFGGVVAVSGPAILAIKGINVALTTLAANPMLLGITATVAGMALLVASIDKYNHQLEDAVSAISKNKEAADSLLDSWSGLNGEKVLDGKTTNELIKLYPQLADKLVAYKTKADEARQAIKDLTKEQTINQTRGQREYLQRLLSQIDTDTKQYNDAHEAYKKAAFELSREFNQGKIDDDTLSYRLSQESTRTNVYNLESNIKNAKETFKKSLQDINREIANTGYMLNKDLQLVEVPVEVKLDPSGAGGNGNDAKKKWQQWFEEITDVAAKQFGDSGKLAGELYIKSLESGFSIDKSIAEKLGEDFDISGALKAQEEEIKKTMKNLLVIDKDNIDAPFVIDNKVFDALKEQAEKIKDTINSISYTKTFNGLQVKINDLTKSEHELAIASYKATGFTDEQAESLANLNDEFSKKEILEEYAKKVAEIGKNEHELTREKLKLLGATEEELRQFDEMAAKLSKGADLKSFQEVFTNATSDMLESWGIVDEAINKTLSDMTYQLVNMSFDAALEGTHELGKALAEGADSGEAMQAAMAAMAQKILDNLPLMFLQAGLQLIANGNWPLGLGFIAAAGSSSIIAGYVDGKTSESSSTTANANGGVYNDSGIMPFAHGGIFANSVVDKPTLFKFAQGTGLMGERGAEAIIPLQRGSDGRLGISAYGGNEKTDSGVTVNIHNYSSERVSQTARTDSRGNRSLEVLVGKMVNGAISSGKADSALGSRYEGFRKRGV